LAQQVSHIPSIPLAKSARVFFFYSTLKLFSYTFCCKKFTAPYDVIQSQIPSHAKITNSVSAVI